MRCVWGGVRLYYSPPSVHLKCGVSLWDGLSSGLKYLYFAISGSEVVYFEYIEGFLVGR